MKDIPIKRTLNAAAEICDSYTLAKVFRLVAAGVREDVRVDKSQRTLVSNIIDDIASDYNNDRSVTNKVMNLINMINQF